MVLRVTAVARIPPKQEKCGEEIPWLLSPPILPLPARALAETNYKKEEWGGIGCRGQLSRV